MVKNASQYVGGILVIALAGGVATALTLMHHPTGRGEIGSAASATDVASSVIVDSPIPTDSPVVIIASPSAAPKPVNYRPSPIPSPIPSPVPSPVQPVSPPSPIPTPQPVHEFTWTGSGTGDTPSTINHSWYYSQQFVADATDMYVRGHFTCTVTSGSYTVQVGVELVADPSVVMTPQTHPYQMGDGLPDPLWVLNPPSSMHYGSYYTVVFYALGTEVDPVCSWSLELYA